MQLTCVVFLVVFLSATQSLKKRPIRSVYLRRSGNDNETSSPTRRYNNGFALTGIPKQLVKIPENHQNNSFRRTYSFQRFLAHNIPDFMNNRTTKSSLLSYSRNKDGLQLVMETSTLQNYYNPDETYHNPDGQEHIEETHHEDTDRDRERDRDQYTFVALIDIMFTDGCKRICTGAIIHTNVVITAAHCFTFLKNKFLQPELTLSFVVIGTKMMFESGYEQYLPIERVLTHPFYHAWTADLALVFTFANMMSDKPGQILPLSSDRSMGPVDVNITVFSWGLCRTDEDALDNADLRKHQNIQQTQSAKIKSNENHASHKKTQNQPRERINWKPQPKYVKIGNKHHEESTEQTEASLPKHDTQRNHVPERKKKPSLPRKRVVQKKHKDAHVLRNPHPAAKNRAPFSRRTMKELRKKHIQTFFDLEDYDETRPLELNQNKPIPDATANRRSNLEKNPPREFDKNNSKELAHDNLDDLDDETRHLLLEFHRMNHVQHRSWRRFNTAKHKNLTIGVFGYVNIDTCKRLIERSLPPMYEIRNKSEYLCYSSEELYITNEDSGAPVVQQEELVAVTVGGVVSEGDHVAIGIKVACYCAWIANHMPKYGGPVLKCCHRCCDENFKRRRLPAYGEQARAGQKHNLMLVQDSFSDQPKVKYVEDYYDQKKADEFRGRKEFNDYRENSKNDPVTYDSLEVGQVMRKIIR